MSGGLSLKEIIFQIFLHLFVFIFYSFDKNRPQIQSHQFFFFLNYAAASFFINYVLLPQFFYRKRYLLFFLFTLISLGGVIVVEELVLERIYFPDTRGRRFNAIFYTLLDVLPIITILSGFKFAWDALNKQQEVDELKAAIQESELQFLKSQINPHFLFNNLNNLYSYTLEQSPKAPAIILELSSVLRYMLYECRADHVPLTKEIQQLENFTRLSELQIEERGEISFQTHGIRSDFQIAPLVLIVFIENAFKHSQANLSENIWIDIRVELSPEGKLEFFCANNYAPQAPPPRRMKGIGLDNVKKRLRLIYPDSHQLEIREENDRYEVNLSLWLDKVVSS